MRKAVSPEIVAAADRLRLAESARQPCPPIRTLLEASDIRAAYAVQETNVLRGLAQGRRMVGQKIGLTAKSVQRQLGVDQPDYGILFADMEVTEGETVAQSRVLQPKIEAEVALVLERDLNFEQPTIADVIRATAYVLPAIEIVGSRIAGWDITIMDTIADNASSGAFVLGQTPRSLAEIDLRLCGMAIFHQGEPVSVGAGAACMGSPLIAAQWLARTMVGVGRPLLAGAIVLTGALGPMVVARPGDFFEARIEGLGRVSVGFGAEQPND
jgi:2-keto-4-pentenoate hydratase